MKKLFALAAIFTLIFTACEQSVNDDNTPKLPNLTIRNESSYVLTDVKFSGIAFSTSGNDLPTSSQSVKQLTANDLNKAGYITFTRKDIGIACRTEAISIGDADHTFTFLDTTVVEEIANSGNKKSLAQITFISKVAVELGGLAVPRNDIIDIEEVVNFTKQTEFSLKNAGVGKLLLTGTQPVKITGTGVDAFSVVQPTSSEIAPNGSLTFKLNFAPDAVQDYNATVTISSNDQDGDFTFTIRARGVSPKPIAEVYYGNSEITQNGTINAGEELITLSKNITVIIKNTGTEVLNLDTANITITGADYEAFIRTTNPGGSISAGDQTLFDIECKPAKQGENNAVLNIPTNDESRNPITVYLKVTGVKGSTVFELRNGNTIIGNNSGTPSPFGQVVVGQNQTVRFTITNNGNIAFNLTGNPVIESSNHVFSVSSPPAITTLNPAMSTTFDVRYTPTVENEVTSTITIANNSDEGTFSFSVAGRGYIYKSVASILYDDEEIAQNGTIHAGEVRVDLSRSITVTISNTGDADLTIDRNNISITGAHAAAFSISANPNVSVQSESNTTFNITCSPLIIGENSAVLTIPTNDTQRNPVIINLKVTGRGYIIGEVGPGGGLVFYANGNQFKECSDHLGLGRWDSAVTWIETIHRGGGYNDWYLPELWELKLIYQNLYLNDLGEFYDDDEFWSATTVGETGAMILDFADGVEYANYKTTTGIGVIAIRSFSL